MGCGINSISTIESNRFKLIELNERELLKKYSKIDEELNKRTENEFAVACESCDKEEDINILLKELHQEYPTLVKEIKISYNDQKEAICYRVAKNKIYRCISKDFKYQSEIIKNMLVATKPDLLEKLSEQFEILTGSFYNLVLLNLENSLYLLKYLLQILKNENEFLDYETVILLLPEQVLYNKETMIQLASFIKLKSNLKNLVIAFSKDGEPQGDMNLLSFLLQGIAASKSLKNFVFLRTHDTAFLLEQKTVNEISDSIFNCKLTSLALINISFTKDARKTILDSISKNSYLKSVALQLIGVGESCISEIVDSLSVNKNIKSLILGLNSLETDLLIDEKTRLLKSKNSNFEVFAIDYFRK